MKLGYNNYIKIGKIYCVPTDLLMEEEIECVSFFSSSSSSLIVAGATFALDLPSQL